jgi:hypothetical protein
VTTGRVQLPIVTDLTAEYSQRPNRWPRSTPRSWLGRDQLPGFAGVALPNRQHGLAGVVVRVLQTGGHNSACPLRPRNSTLVDIRCPGLPMTRRARSLHQRTVPRTGGIRAKPNGGTSGRARHALCARPSSTAAVGVPMVMPSVERATSCSALGSMPTSRRRSRSGVPNQRAVPMYRPQPRSTRRRG